jgi:hypothetical protein
MNNSKAPPSYGSSGGAPQGAVTRPTWNLPQGMAQPQGTPNWQPKVSGPPQGGPPPEDPAGRMPRSPIGQAMWKFMQMQPGHPGWLKNYAQTLPGSGRGWMQNALAVRGFAPPQRPQQPPQMPAPQQPPQQQAAIVQALRSTQKV